MKRLVLGIASLMVIPNIAILLLVGRPRPAAVVSQVSETGIQQIVIRTASEWKFDTPQITLPPVGQRVRLVFVNAGDVRHTFTIKDLVNSDVVLDLGQAGTIPKALAESAAEGAGKGIVFLVAEPGGTAVAEFTVGGKSADYQAICSLKGHERRGMKAAVTVP